MVRPRLFPRRLRLWMVFCVVLLSLCLCVLFLLSCIPILAGKLPIHDRLLRFGFPMQTEMPSSKTQQIATFFALCIATSLGQSIVEYPVANGASGTFGIAAGPDGALWFTREDGIGRISVGGDYTLFANEDTHLSSGIAQGLDGAMWFTCTFYNKIGRLAANSSYFNFFPVPTANSSPSGIAQGLDGDLWFTEYGANKIGRLSVFGDFTEYRIPTNNSGPVGIAAGPDGALWFTEQASNKIGRITILDGSFTEYSIPTANSAPDQIARGPDGALWFTERFSNKIGRITVGGSVSEYRIPTIAFGLSGIAQGGDGALWFTGSRNIGRITVGGVITTYSIVADFAEPPGLDSIALGPDGALWFTEHYSNKIGRIAGTCHLHSFQLTHVWIAAAKPARVAPAPKTSILDLTSLTLSWTAPADNVSPITSYQILMQNSTGPFFVYAASTGSASVTATITSLSPGLQYAFKVAARNLVGLGDASDASSTVTTQLSGTWHRPFFCYIMSFCVSFRRSQELVKHCNPFDCRCCCLRRPYSAGSCLTPCLRTASLILHVLLVCTVLSAVGMLSFIT
jgi:virginiamycin B lyase